MDNNDLYVRRPKQISPSSLWTWPSMWFWRFPSTLCELRQEVIFPKDTNFPSDNASHTRIERSLTMPNPESMADGGDSQRILWPRFLKLPGGIGSAIICMNDEATPNGPRTQFTNWLQNIFDIVCRVKWPPFWTHVDSVKPERIPCDCNHHFSGFDYVFFAFSKWFAVRQLDDFLMCR
jgi:hypothetical protein